ncbi:sugar phosphate isomerase/epimerase family protein [Paenibacillus sp. KN14-4R]|uniref:sugar phosphate isomerase/epimerase family protein n=1 Tax=Paenibacillus sp. KN14-4R TaxID=3445773 RepID=UPI003FA15F23
MKQFMIGQYGHFDSNKFEKDFRNDFHGIEACLFTTHEDCLNLMSAARDRKFQIGVHYPFRAHPSRLRDAPFLSSDETIREEAFQHVQEELDYLTTVQPEYVLFHYPKPVILDDRVNWDQWRFTDPSEYVMESNYTFDELVERSEALFKWLTEKSKQYHFVPVLEFDALNKYIYETDYLEKLLEQYPTIKLCLDTGRLFIQEKIDPYFDALKIIRKYAKYAHSIHLWNVQVKDGIRNNRYPVLPHLSPEEGWAPIEAYLTIIREENSDVRIMFEHNSSLVSEEQLEQCYTWVDHILNKQADPRFHS